MRQRTEPIARAIPTKLSGTAKLFQRLQQLLCRKRLLQIFDTADLKRLLFRALVRVPRHEDDRRGNARFSQAIPQLDARAFLQVDVEQYAAGVGEIRSGRKSPL